MATAAVCVHVLEAGPRGVVAQLGSRVRIALAGLDILPAPRLVLVVGMVLLVLDPQPLSLFHKGALFVLTQQTAGKE